MEFEYGGPTDTRREMLRSADRSKRHFTPTRLRALLSTVLPAVSLLLGQSALHPSVARAGNCDGFANYVDEIVASDFALESETDLNKRNSIIGDIWRQVQADQIYLPIHNQVLNWGMKDNVQFDVQPEDQPHFKYLTFK